ncbi:MAG: M48 family metallopeptidase [Elusimicrobiota bacterium]
MNIYEQQQKNKRLTWVLVIIFILFFLFLGFGFDYFYLSYTKIKYTGDSEIIERNFIPFGTITALLISIIMVINAFKNGIKMIIASTGARPANLSNLKEKQFYDVVEEMAIACGIPRPQAFIISDSDLNAFATGFTPQNSYVFITEGLLEQLNREELQAVIAHEISHIRFYDIRLLTMITVLMNTIAIISDFIARSNRAGLRSSPSSRSSRKSSGNGIIFFIWIILIILAPIISRILAMAISRQREYLADAGASELTRNPKALISALEKIRKAIQPTKSIKDSIAHLCIADPRGSLIEEKTGFLANLFATHPPMEKRILALKLMAYEASKT